MFETIFKENVCSVFARQLALLDFLGAGNWNIDIKKGEFSTGDDTRLPIQVLGTESHQDNSWLWGWANTQSNLPPTLLTSGSKIKDFGEKLGVEQLSQPKISLEGIDGHKVAIVCTAISNELCYYVAPYNGGALYILLSGLPMQLDYSPIERINTVLMEVISIWELNHREIALPFLTQQGFTIEESANRLTGFRKSDGTIEICFDERGRLTHVSSNKLPEKKAWWKVW